MRRFWLFALLAMMMPRIVDDEGAGADEIDDFEIDDEEEETTGEKRMKRERKSHPKRSTILRMIFKNAWKRWRQRRRGWKRSVRSRRRRMSCRSAMRGLT